MKSLNLRSFIVFILFFGVIFAAQTRAQSDSRDLKEFQEGLKLVQTEEYEKAITAFLASVQKDPKFADGWMMLGVTMFEVDLWDAATPCLQKAIELKPEIASIQEIRLLLPLIGARPFPRLPQFHKQCHAEEGNQCRRKTVLRPGRRVRIERSE